MTDKPRYQVRIRHQGGFGDDEPINLFEMFLGDVGIWDTVEERWLEDRSHAAERP
jgi:hypothetical protein